MRESIWLLKKMLLLLTKQLRCPSPFFPLSLSSHCWFCWLNRERRRRSSEKPLNDLGLLFPSSSSSLVQDQEREEAHHKGTTEEAELKGACLRVVHIVGHVAEAEEKGLFFQYIVVDLNFLYAKTLLIEFWPCFLLPLACVSLLNAFPFLTPLGIERTQKTQDTIFFSGQVKVRKVSLSFFLTYDVDKCQEFTEEVSIRPPVVVLEIIMKVVQQEPLLLPLFDVLHDAYVQVHHQSVDLPGFPVLPEPTRYVEKKSLEYKEEKARWKLNLTPLSNKNKALIPAR